jgi:hypothetical protein
MSGGGAYGASKALNTQEQGAPMATTPTGTSAASAPERTLPQVGTLLDESTNPSEPITAGVDFGRGPGSEALPQINSSNTRPDENKAVIAQYLPDLVQAASYKDAPDSFKRFVNYLVGQ